MEIGIFQNVALNENNPTWQIATARINELYTREGDIRSPFLRDYTRVLHSLAYRRLKHKTQVFYNAAGNDHICTRIEHVAHVDSVSNSIAKSLGLNEELTRAIAIAHDLGHAPFGHQGEKCLTAITEKYLGEKFWHEKNGVYIVDNLELLENPKEELCNLNLSYAVRDGIISHCGEVDQNGIHPREEMFSLDNFKEVGQYQAATWEGCVVKLSDKIAYLGRDIEDAGRLDYFSQAEKNMLKELARKCNKDAVNTTVITHSMINDICENSTPEKGLCFSDEMNEILNEIKRFNYKYIYGNKRLDSYRRYSELVINTIFEELISFYAGDLDSTLAKLSENNFGRHNFVKGFATWLPPYCTLSKDSPSWAFEQTLNAKDNIKIYGALDDEKIYIKAVVDYIAGMTDNYAASAFTEMLEC